MDPIDLTSISPEEWLKNESNFTKLLEDSSWDHFPLLNYVDSCTLKEGQLVRFKGMVQDMHTPNYYFDKCIIVNRETQEKRIKNGKYSEFIKCHENESISTDANDSAPKEVQTLYVISTPGENQWVRDIESQKNNSSSKASTSNSLQGRGLEDDTMEIDDQPPVSSTQQCKKQCKSPPKQSTTPCLDISNGYLNFPIEDRNMKACLVKSYEPEGHITFNKVYDFIGFVSVDPKLSHEIYCAGETETTKEDQIHNPPPSLIPRLHCVTFRQSDTNSLVSDVQLDFEAARKELIKVLTSLLLGDEIAAEYFLYYLISAVYMRRNEMALGKFSLNVSNIPIDENMKYVETLYQFVELLVPKSVYFPLTVNNMNEKTFVPKKDYEIDRLNSGLLQLSSDTCLILDETKLQPGELNQAGVMAVRSIANAITSQKVSYDFNFYPIDFECDIKFLIASEGKSLLPSDCHVVLQPNKDNITIFSEIIAALKHFLKPELLNQFRKYLMLCKQTKYNLEDEMQPLITDKFVQMRQNGGTGDDLHTLLGLNRLICMSYGKVKTDAETLNYAFQLEKKRKERIKN